MPYYPYIPSGTYILEVNPSGATPLASGGLSGIEIMTGAGGPLASSGFQTATNFFFAHTTGSGYLAEHNPSNIALATGTGYIYGDDIRGTGDNYQMWGTSTATGLNSQVEHFVGAYAELTDAAGKTLTGLISGGNGYYTGSYTTLPPLQQFVTILPTVDTGNLGYISTGSGVHLFRDVTLTFSEIIDRAGATLETQDQLQNNIFFDGFDIDILDITGGMAFTGYKSGLKSRSFSFSEQENINVFGTYTPDFGIRYSVQDQNGKEQVNEIYLYGNPLEIDSLYITDASGRYLSQSNDSNFITTGSGVDELFLTNRQYVTGTPSTGSVDIEFNFKNDPNYTHYGNSVHVYGQTGSADFARNANNFIATIPLTQDKAGQIHQLTPKDGDAEGLLTETDYYFQLEPESPITKGKVFRVGPHKIQPVEQDPRNAGQPLYNRGNQYLVGDLDVSGCMTGRCLTIQTPTYPQMIDTAGGNVGIGTTPGTSASDPKLMVNGNLGGTGIGGRATGPGGLPYLLTGDAGGGAGAVTLQTATDNGSTTTNDITVGNSSAATAPLTIVTDGSTKSGIDVYADGDLGNKILTLKADSNAAGEISIKDTAGVDSVKISNTSSRGQVDLYDDGGVVRMTAEVDSNEQGKLTLKDSSANDSVKLSSDSNRRGNMTLHDSTGVIRMTALVDSSEQGELTLKDSSANDSVKLSSDSNKRGTVSVHDSAGVIRMTALVDSNEQGELTLKDSSANESIKLASDSNKRGVVDIYDAAGTSKIEMKADSNDEGVVSIKDSLGTLATKVQGHKSIISAAYSNIYSTGSVIIGGSGHIISGDYDVIAGGAENQISGNNGDFNFIGGGSGLDVSESKYSSSVGGLNNDITTGDYSIIAGGAGNDISGSEAVLGDYCFIGGGSGVSLRDAPYSSSVGGFDNDINGASFSVIGGGYSSTITGNLDELTTVASLIGGGVLNRISGSVASAIVGGGINTITGGSYNFIGGGLSNQTTGFFSAIVAGRDNDIYGAYSTIGGGRYNEISGVDYGFIGGGYGNKVSGQYSYAFGHNALVASGHSGAAVLADGQDRTHASSGENTLNLDFASGVYIGGGGALYVSGNPVMTGAHTVEADTFQTVTNRGDTTTNSIEVAGKYLSGVTGAFSRDVTVGNDFTVDTTSFFVDASTDRVGVGTASNIASKLDVLGNISVGAGGYYAGSSPAPTDGMIIKGTVGIGTTSPSSASNLHVYGSGIFGTYTSTPTNGLVVEGNVGVGTSSPSTALDVRGTISGYTGLFDDKVGIGTNAPTEMLGIAPNTDVSAEIGRAHVGSVGHTDYAGFSHIDRNSTTEYALLQQSNGATYVNSKAGTNIYFLQGNSVKGGFNTSNDFYIDTDTLYVDVSEDRVGINTSTPSTALDVRGTISGYTGLFSGAQIGATGGGLYPLEIVASGNNQDLIRLSHPSSPDDAGFMIGFTNDGAGDNNNATLGVEYGGTDYDVINIQRSSRNVGIGTNNPVSGAAHIYKNATINTITAPNAQNATLHIEDSSNNMYIDGNSILSDANSWISTTGSNYLAFGTSNTERIRIESGGDVGVGTTNPSYTLEVTKSDSSSLLSRFYNSSSTNGQGLLIRAGETSNYNRVLQLASRNDTKVMTVNSNGKVGIGTTEPTTTLEVIGDSNLDGDVTVDGSVTSVTDITATTSSSYTFVAGDQSNMVSFNSANPITGLIPPNSSVPFPIGTEIGVFQLGAGQLHITTGSNAVSLNAADGETKARVQYSSAMCVKTGTDGWLLVGDLTS